MSGLWKAANTSLLNQQCASAPCLAAEMRSADPVRRSGNCLYMTVL
jgi:hypothetical protein